MFIRNFSTDYYGDETRWWYGTVEDINDPMKMGRCRVRIVGLHSNDRTKISTGDLPWASVGLPTTESSHSGLGKSSNLSVGSNCFGIFIDGKSSQSPLVLSSIPKVEGNNLSQKQVGLGSSGKNSQDNTDLGSVIDNIKGSNPEKAFNYFVGYGFSPEQSAGIVGNLMVESGPELSTTVKSAGAENSFGIAQWNSAAVAGNRFGMLQEFSKDIGQSWKDLTTQLQFITHELESFPYLGLSSLKGAKTIEQATIAFEEKYERPSQAHRNRRIEYAKEIYNRFQG